MLSRFMRKNDRSRHQTRRLHDEYEASRLKEKDRERLARPVVTTTTPRAS